MFHVPTGFFTTAETVSETNALDTALNQIGLALDAMLGSETSGDANYYATVTTLEESEIYSSVIATLSVVSRNLEISQPTLASMSTPEITYRFTTNVEVAFLSDLVTVKHVLAYQHNISRVINGVTQTFRGAYLSADLISEPPPGTEIFVVGDEDGYLTVLTSCSQQKEWLYRIPDNISNADAQRDFIFRVTSQGYIYDAIVHIAYAEVLVDFAGEGTYEHTTTVGGQTASNTVIVGQKVSAKVESSLSISNMGAFSKRG